ncbi:MAG TPA: sulfate permease [Candidatus Acidoferrum sp.]|jgi:SulP family sulfate permease|nr:sulfate permease [Candidatus Acidoferrum sp.]
MPNQPDNHAPSKPASSLTRYCPGLAQFAHYRREWLSGDLLAGISVCVIMIPSVIAYAGLMGLPPQHGLYAALVPLVVYAIFGSSRQVIVGPDIAISLLIASTIGPLAAGNPARAAALAAVLALLCGLLLLLGARANFGAVADFLSKPVLVGYMTGAALILIASQLGKLLGVSLKSSDFFPRLLELAGKLHQVHGPTLALGLTLLALSLALRRFTPKIPAALAACAIAIAASLVFRLEGQGVTLVGSFPRGLPGFALPGASWRDVDSLLPAAIGITLLTYTEGILLARAFAAKNGYEVSANQELNALGLADVAVGLFQGFSITGSQARTTVNDATGGKTQLASLVAAATLGVFLLFLTPVIARLPEVALAAILIYAGVGLVEFDVMARIYRFYPRSAAVAALTTLSVLAAGVVVGILFGVALSLLGLINRISNPPDAVLSEVPGSGFHDLGSTQPQTLPGLIAYRFYAPLLFSNAGHFVGRVRALIAASPQPVRWFLLDAQAITDIDVTAVEALHGLREELQRQGIALKIAHVNRPLRELLQRTGLASEIRPESFFQSVHECAEAFKHSGAGLSDPVVKK